MNYGLWEKDVHVVSFDRRGRVRDREKEQYLWQFRFETLTEK